MVHYSNHFHSIENNRLVFLLLFDFSLLLLPEPVERTVSVSLQHKRRTELVTERITFKYKITRRTFMVQDMN